LTGPDQVSLEQKLLQIAPGRYEARFSASRRGINLLTLVQEGETGAESTVAATVPYTSPYPKEYREVKPNTALLSLLAEETGGEILKPATLEEGLRRLLTPGGGKGQAARETWWALSILAILLFLADLALRRWSGRVGSR
jgi:hypothetical protein